jgi:hypothetical protein
MAGIRSPDNAAPFGSPAGIDWRQQCTLFVLCSQHVLFKVSVLAYFDPEWPSLNLYRPNLKVVNPILHCHINGALQ